MAATWQALTELAATPATDDEVLVKDTSDTTDDAVGTVKRNSRSNFLGSVLGATTASFTTADETKLDGIEALADVTDAANVAAAGAHMAGGTDVPVLDGGTGASTAAGARTNLELVVGTNVQAWDAQLDTWATVTPSANGQSLVAAANYAAMRGLLDLEAGTDFYSLSAADAKFTDTANSPGANEFARFTDATTIEGRTAAETRADLDLEAGTDFYSISAANAAFQPVDADLTVLSTAFTSAAATTAAALKLAEATNNGSTGVALTGPTTSGGEKVVTFQDVTGTVYVTGGTDVAVADGGTGASDAATARTNLGLVIGTDVAPINNATFTGTFAAPNDSISYAEIQNVSATDRLLGRDTAAAGDIEELTVSGGLEFTGGPGIQRSALTGDVTASAGNNATTIAAGVVTYAKIQNVSATDKLLGRSTAGAGVVEEIICTATGRNILDDTTTAAVLTTIGALPLAGGTLTGALTLGSGASIAGGDKVASALEIKDVGETAPAAGSITGSITRSFADGAVQELTLTGNVTALSISNPPASGIAGTITFIINHGTGPYTWSHPSGIKWPAATAPTMSSGASDISIVSYMTRDGGTTWYGFFSGADFS